MTAEIIVGFNGTMWSRPESLQYDDIMPCQFSMRSTYISVEFCVAYRALKPSYYPRRVPCMPVHTGILPRRWKTSGLQLTSSLSWASGATRLGKIQASTGGESDVSRNEHFSTITFNSHGRHRLFLLLRIGVDSNPQHTSATFIRVETRPGEHVPCTCTCVRVPRRCPP